MRRCSRQTADPLDENSQKCAVFAEWVCTLAESVGTRALVGRYCAVESRARCGPGSRALLLAPLTRSCAAKPYGRHGGQPVQAAIYRVNLRIKGPRPPPIGLTCAVTSARATTTTNQSNVARNSPPHISNFEIGPLELQRLWAISKNDRVKLRATFAKTVTAVTLGPLYRPRELRPGLATTNSFTKNRNHHEDLQSAAPRPHGPLQNAPPRPLTFVMAPPASKDTSGPINTSANWVP